MNNLNIYLSIVSLCDGWMNGACVEGSLSFMVFGKRFGCFRIFIVRGNDEFDFAFFSFLFFSG